MKDAYYFPHFSNARHDRKIKRLRLHLGNEGYALYFMTLEVLRDQTDFRYPLMDIDLLADEFGVTKEKMNQVILDYKLFVSVGDMYEDDSYFYSPKLNEFMQPYLEKSKKAREAAKKRWSTNAKQMQSDSNTSKVKESKVNETKVNKSKINLYK